MSEVRELPHELLLRKYGLNVSELSKHTQQLKKDLDKTITFIVNKSKNGNINLTPALKVRLKHTIGIFVMVFSNTLKTKK